MSGKIDLVKIIRSNRVAVLVLACIIIALFIYGVLFFPRMKLLGAKYSECRLCEAKVMDARNLIEHVSRLDKKSGARVLVSEKEAAAGIDEFTRHSKSLGINFLSIKPGNIVIQEGMPYKVLPIEMQLEATGEQFVKFLGTIDELKKAIVTVRSFNIESDADTAGKLNVEITIDLYLSLRDDHAG